MNIIPFKNRQVELNRPVKIYRNLNARFPNEAYSIKQGRYVVAHTNDIILNDCVFFVSEKGKQRVRSTGKKCVHAFVEGVIGEFDELPINLFAKVTYNPFNNDKFMCNNSPINSAKLIVVHNGLFVVENIENKNE